MVITAQDTKLKPGYKQTEVGVIPVDWEISSLETFISFISYGFTNPMPSVENGVYMITAKDINHGKIQFDTARCTSEEAYQTLLTAKSRPKKDDLLLTKDGTLGRLALVDNRKVCINQSVAVLRPNSKIVPKFLKVLLEAPLYQNRMLEEAGGSTIKHIYITIVNRMPVAVPSNIDEQNAIANVLSDNEDLIERLEELITKKRDIKKATMQQLLTGKMRLPEFSEEPKTIYKQTEAGMIPVDWNVRTLGQLGEFKNGINKGKMDFGHGFPFVNLMDVFGAVRVSNDSGFGLVSSTDAERKIFNLKKGDILFVRSSVKSEGVGLTTLVAEDLRNTVYSGFLIRFRDKGELAFEFKEHYFGQFGFRNRLIAKSTLSANTNINQNALKNLQIAFPLSKAEQQAIATILTDMDAEISALVQKRDKTRALKQGMMQELLTGKTRLV